MPNEEKERWQILCEQAALEQDPQKLLLLVRELNEALKEKEDRLSTRHEVSPAESSKDAS